MSPNEGKHTRVAAYGLIVADKRILLCRLSERASTHQGFWTLPGGGINFGEDPADAMIREVLEETGLQVRPVEVVAINSWVAKDRTPIVHSLQILYRAEILGGTLAHETGGTTDCCAWHAIEEVASLPIVELVEVSLRVAVD